MLTPVLLLVSVALPIPAAPGTPDQELNALVEGYYDQLLQLTPLLATYNGESGHNHRPTPPPGPENLARALKLEQTYLKKARSISVDSHTAEERLTHTLFVRGREEAIAGDPFPGHLMPVNQFHCFPIVFAMLGAGGSIQPFETVRDYDNWLGRVEGWGPWVDQAIMNMRLGMESGVVLPRIIAQRTVDLLDRQITENPRKSPFFRPIEAMPSSIGGDERARLERAYVAAVRDKIVPPFRRLRDFMRDEYMKSTRKSVGLSQLPGGKEWYAYLVRAHTTTDLTPEEIHRIGLREVEWLTAEIARVRRAPEPGDTGDDSGGSLLDNYRALRGRVEARLPSLFERIPESDFEIRPVEKFRERSAAGASYVAGTPDGSRPGVFYVNTRWGDRGPASDALFLHEALPGHHFQISLQRELGELPRFRRFGGFTAFSEGWGLYAERLGDELGLYRSRAQRVDALGSELFRARRLVVDTGIHAMGWSRQQAIDYIGSVNEVDRYITLPGQALAYKIGQLRILALRERAREELGEGFDIRAFHRTVLEEGALPLDVLEARVETWIVEQKASTE